MSRWKTRELLSKYPWLDALRMKVLAVICNHGTTFFDRSYRIIKIFSPGAYSLLKSKVREPVLFALYHGQMVGSLGIKPRKKLTILISASRDGEMIARGAEGLGFSVARGSKAHGAVKGALTLLQAVQDGQDIAFMVDGPRGPKFQVKSGVIRIAQIANTPIIPFVCSAKAKWQMKSWDGFIAPSWGTPIVYIFGEPLSVKQNSSDEQQEELRLKLESYLERLRQVADAMF